MVKNSYPELPEVPYRKTSVDMNTVIRLIREFDIPRTVKIAAYVMFRNESGNGQSGINNNYMGIQADSGRWSLNSSSIVGTVVKNENKTGKPRRFLAFDSVQGSLEFLIDRIEKRGLFVGGTTNRIITMKVSSATDWTVAYYRSWVKGNANENIPSLEQRNLLSMYAQGEKLF